MAVPQWTQNSGYKLATLQERVTSSITLPLLQDQQVEQLLTQEQLQSVFHHNQEYKMLQI